LLAHLAFLHSWICRRFVALRGNHFNEKGAVSFAFELSKLHSHLISEADTSRQIRLDLGYGLVFRKVLFLTEDSVCSENPIGLSGFNALFSVLQASTLVSRFPVFCLSRQIYQYVHLLEA
jgi:hypothetical protein